MHKPLLVLTLPLSFVLLLLGAGSCAAQGRNSRAILTETPPPYDHKITYGNDPSQFGELRLPKNGKTPYPVAVIIHGGCWMAEYGLGYLGHLSADLAQAGVATWNLEYRRVGNAGGGWPGSFADVAQGVEHLRTLAKTYRLDLQRVVAIGHSAGGHLALLLAKREKAALPLRGVVALAGITDLRRTGTACDVNVGMLMNGAVQAQYDAASPIALLPLGVKQIIIQGDSDRIIPTAMATDYVERAKAKGDDVKLVLLEKAGHFEVVDPQTGAWAKVKEEVLVLLKAK